MVLGKTTLIRLILGFLKPTKGDISLNTKNIGYVPQKKESYTSGFPITVEELISSYAKIKKAYTKTIVEETLKLVSLESKRKELVSDLSRPDNIKSF